MGDIAQRGNRLTKKHISKDLVRNVYDAVAPKHSPGQKGKPHSSKEGRAASFGRTVRDVGKILSPERVKKFGGGRTNLLEELGRVEAEPSNRNRRAEISRVHGELNRGYKHGKRVTVKRSPTHPDDLRPEQEIKRSGRTGAKRSPTHPDDLRPAEHAKGGRAGFSTGREVKKHLKKFIEVGKEHVARKEAAKVQARKDEIRKSDMGYAKGGRIGFKKGTDKRWMQKVSASIKKRGTKGKCTPITKPGCTGRAKALAKTFKKIAAKRKKS